MSSCWISSLKATVSGSGGASKPKSIAELVNNDFAASPDELKERFDGVMQTVWSGMGSFLEKDYKSKPDATNSWNCFTAMFGEIKKLQPESE